MIIPVQIGSLFLLGGASESLARQIQKEKSLAVLSRQQIVLIDITWPFFPFPIMKGMGVHFLFPKNQGVYPLVHISATRKTVRWDSIPSDYLVSGQWSTDHRGLFFPEGGILLPDNTVILRGGLK